MLFVGAAAICISAIGAIATIAKAAKATAVVDGLSDLRSIDRSEAVARMSDHSPGGAPNSLNDAHHQAMAEEPARGDPGAVLDVIDGTQQVSGFVDDCSEGLGFCADHKPRSAQVRELASRPRQPIQSYTAADAAAKRAQLNSIIERGLSSGDDWDAIGRAIQDAFPRADVPRLVEAARKKHAEILQRTTSTAVGRDLGAADLSEAIQGGHR